MRLEGVAMSSRWNPREHIWLTGHAVKWLLIATPVGAAIGSAVALFLWALDVATRTRWDHPWLLFLLPVAGLFVGQMYHLLGKSVEGGTDLIMDQIHKPGGGVPARMAPLVLLTTVITHLFGGSAGREGTAVQIGGSLAQFFAKKLSLSAADTRMLLTTGIAAGFGAVFGTPVTGAIFALEVLAMGRIKHDALMPCFIASVLADITCSAWGIHHTQYRIHFAETGVSLLPFLHFDVLLLIKVIAAGILFGLAGYGFAEVSHTIKNYSNRWIKPAWLIPISGGIIIILFSYVLGTRDYLSLGVKGEFPHSVTIPSCFLPGGATYF